VYKDKKEDCVRIVIICEVRRHLQQFSVQALIL